SRRRHTRFSRDWSSDVCSSDLMPAVDRSGLQPDVNLGGGELVRRGDDPVPQVGSALQIVLHLERIQLLTVRVHQTRLQFLRTDVDSDKQFQKRTTSFP